MWSTSSCIAKISFRSLLWLSRSLTMLWMRSILSVIAASRVSTAVAMAAIRASNLDSSSSKRDVTSRIAVAALRSMSRVQL